MIKPPEHPLGPAFEKAREWAREQERLLTRHQREAFAALRHRQAKEREIRQKWLDGARAQLREREKNQKAKAELALKPPMRVADPETRRLARLAIANEKRLERLDARHHAEAVKLLQKFEQERAKENANNLGDAWLRAVNKSAAQEHDRSREKTRERDPLDRSR
jgi:hypothetical protein